ncbi:PadR family transcriptional regulator [Methanobacterium aggregans]|uniref:PadR family transcriptional regulator n=1 Tax=Methanobacterium aggregans TaxID=1615586 RepID=UPI001AE9D14B
MKCSSNMKGYLSFLILWILHRKGMKGSEIRTEFERRKGKKPSPGTIYPALKELRERGLIRVDEHKTYFLTEEGEEKLKTGCKSFCQTFYDVEDMFKFCN